MKNQTYRFLLTAAVGLLLLSLVLVPAASAQKYCGDKTKITRLGDNPLGDSVGSPAALQQEMEEHRQDILRIMEDKGLGHLVGLLYAAVESGDGLSDRTLQPGDTFLWMAARKKGQALATNQVCLEGERTYPAYEIIVTEEKADAPPPVNCNVKASGMCAHEKIKVDASGSTSGAVLTMTGPDGKTKKLSGSTWEGMPSGEGKYTFAVEGSATGTKTMTPHTFVVPQICTNLAYEGPGASKTVPGEAVTCSEQASVTIKTCAPECSLSAPATIGAKETFTLDADGYYDDLSVAATNADGKAPKLVDGNGVKIDSIGDLPVTLAIKKKGIYTFTAEATNSAGTATCEAQVEVTGSDRDGAWTFRFFPLKAWADDEVFVSSFRPDGVNERSDLHLGNGFGFGLNLERHFNDRVGLEVGLLRADFDTTLFYDLDDLWAHDDADATMTVLSIGPNFHLTPGSNVDFYIGPFLAFVDVDSFDFNVLGDNISVSGDEDFSFGAQLGLDVPFGGSSWGLHFGVKYIDASISIDEFEGQELAIDPFLAEIGLAYRF